MITLPHAILSALRANARASRLHPVHKLAQARLVEVGHMKGKVKQAAGGQGGGTGGLRADFYRAAE